jgi:hypothetical protein
LGASVLIALFVGSAAYATLQTGGLPVWTGWVGYAVALLNLASVPAIYGGSDPKNFYSAAGLAGLVMGFVPFRMRAGDEYRDDARADADARDRASLESFG